MTEENRRLNAGDSRLLAEEFLAATRAMVSAGLWNRAVSTLYYAVLHAARALLMTEGIQPRSHNAVLRLLGLHFIRPGILDPEHSQTLGELQDHRAAADYTPSFELDEPEYREFERRAKIAFGAIDALLRDRGVELPSDPDDAQG